MNKSFYCLFFLLLTQNLNAQNDSIKLIEAKKILRSQGYMMFSVTVSNVVPSFIEKNIE